MIGQKNTKVFWHQSEARTGLTVWNWSVKTLSPGALLCVLDFSSPEFFFARFRLLPVPTNCPWVSEDGLELATQLISHHASIFLGVIVLGMNKPRPWKCPWTSSKKRKKRTKNENTAMNEQAKVEGKLKLRLSGIKPAKEKIESRVFN